MVWKAATKQGRRDGHKPWDHVKHPTLRKHTCRRTQEQAMNNRWVKCMWYTLLWIGIKHTLWCDVMWSPLLEFNHNSIILTWPALFLRNNYWRHRIERNLSIQTDILLLWHRCSHTLFEKALFGLPWHQGRLSLKYVGSHDSSVKKVLAVAQVCNNNGAEIQTRAFRTH